MHWLFLSRSPLITVFCSLFLWAHFAIAAASFGWFREDHQASGQPPGRNWYQGKDSRLTTWFLSSATDQLNFVANSQGITKPKETRKFKGEGMPLYQSNKKGDLYVTFEVLFPKTLTDDQKAKLKDVLV